MLIVMHVLLSLHQKRIAGFVFVGLVVIWGVWVGGGGVIASEKNSWFLFV